MVKCACGEPNCRIGLYSEDSKHLWLTDQYGKQTLMYLDEDTLDKLVTMLLSAVTPSDSEEVSA